MTAARVGLPGIPVSMRTTADQPYTGIGSGHWRRHAERLRGAVDRARTAVTGAPPGAVREEELDRLLHILVLRADRYTRFAEVGQAVAPDVEHQEEAHPG